MLKHTISVALTASVMAVSGLANAQTTPVGLWKTIDDVSKTERSLVRISESGGYLTGHIEKLLDPKARPNAACDACTDNLKGKPLIGLPVIRGVKQDDDDKTLWGHGIITDVKSGRVYKVRLKPIDGGQKLEVHGFLGVPLFGRTQTWIRVE